MHEIRRGQRRNEPGEVPSRRPAADALERIRAEQARAAAELAAGARDVRGLQQCITDWLMEEAILTAPRLPAS